MMPGKDRSLLEMAERAPSFQWYPKDCDTDENIRLMDDAEFGFFMRCLNHSWLNDGLPGDMDDIARLFGRPRKKLDALWRRVGRCFYLVDGRWRNKRQEEQRKASQEYSEVRRKAAETRWGKPDAYAYAKAHPHALHEQCPPSASASASASAAAAYSPPPQNWPLAHAAVRSKFRLSDVTIVQKIADAACKLNPALTDEKLAQLIDFAWKPGQKGAGLFINTVPALLASQIAEARDEQQNQGLEDERGVAKILDLYSRSDAETRAQLEKNWPELSNRWPKKLGA